MLSNVIKTGWFHCFILTVIVCAVFGNTLSNGFVWDDSLFVASGNGYRNFDVKTIFFSLANGLEYLPVRDISYAVDFLLWGDNPAGFHFSNVLYYWLTVLVIYALSKKLAAIFAGEDAAHHDRTKFVALFTAALFAVHPIHSEVVSFVTCRNALLSGLFFFLSGHIYLLWTEEARHRQRLTYAAALFCFVLSLYSKATGIILPLLLAMLTCFLPSSRRSRSMIGLIPYLLISAATFFLFRNIAIRTRVMDDTPLWFTIDSLVPKLAVALQIPFFYLTKLCVPFGFSADYTPAFSIGMVSIPALTALTALTGSTVMAFACRKRFPALFFCLIWFLIALIPVLNLFPTRPIVADRYAYLPAFSVFFLFATVIARRIPDRLIIRPAYVMGAVVLFLSILAINQNRVWQSDLSLWTHARAISPFSATAATNLSVALSNAGRTLFREGRNYEKAIALFRQAKELDSHNFTLELFTGCLFLIRNDPARAIEVFNAALIQDKNNAEIVLNLGNAYEMTGDTSSARNCYLQVVNSISPNHADLRERAQQYLERLGPFTLNSF